MARTKAIEEPHPPDLPESFDAAPAELSPGASWDSVEAGESTAVPPVAADVQLRDSRWVRADLVGRRLTGFLCRNVVFTQCDLSGAVLEGAELTRVVFESCRMNGVILSGAALQDVRLVDCRADMLDLRMARVRRSSIENCSARESDLYRARLVHTRLVDSDLSRSSFDEVNTDRLSLRGSVLDGVRGAQSLAGAEIDTDQVLPLGTALVTALGFRVM